MLKRENRRVYLVVYLDDHSRFIVGYGVWASAGGALVREVLEAAIANFGAPEEVLTDNGPQYVTWRGTSAFAKLLERRGIRHLVARPRRPQTLGKTERFWGTLWRECVEAAVFLGLDDARRRVGHFIDHYNFQRPHQGIEGLVPADRFFAAAPQVRETLQARVAANAHDLAVQGTPRKSFYLTGRVGDTDLALHSEGQPRRLDALGWGARRSRSRRAGSSRRRRAAAHDARAARGDGRGSDVGRRGRARGRRGDRNEPAPPQPPPRARRTLAGSLRAKQRAAIVLAVLSGDCPIARGAVAGSASRRPATMLSNGRALQGCCRRWNRGRRERHRVAKITVDQVRLEQEVLRLQALVRATQQARGAAAAPEADRPHAEGRRRARAR